MVKGSGWLQLWNCTWSCLKVCTDGHESLHKLAIVFFTLPTHGSLETKVSMPEIGNYVWDDRHFPHFKACLNIFILIKTECGSCNFS